MSNADVIRKLTEMWNAGDLEGVFRLYSEDAEIRTGRTGRSRRPTAGATRSAPTTQEWASLWETLQIEVDRLEEYGDQIVATGSWQHARRRQRRGRPDADLHPVHVQGWEDRGP